MYSQLVWIAIGQATWVTRIVAFTIHAVEILRKVQQNIEATTCVMFPFCVKQTLFV